MAMNIRAERLGAGMSQSELARAAHVPQPNLSAYENNRRSPSPEVLDRIRSALRARPSARIAQHREAILAAVTAHHGTDPRIFGSVSRGEDIGGSDLDLLVTFTDEASLFDEIGLRLALTDLLGVEVDIVASDTLRGSFRDRVLRESVPV
ncbi:helix-turn-helix domain-containing protein [Pseudactinotalea sp. HY158]|uniref:helix-turn-helix domain-containing protein n=1 Tax=Pseudactinotalea sp. HY158 TaxID=2654547 RepID=UPI00129C5E10|nr:helix-turn-helix domain-containing protein [Pseudactinotalea sp. HY158]QGH69322.1 helix-turn-helix domain-containing protein [Pseudactinotalea sp. HY158]